MPPRWIHTLTDHGSRQSLVRNDRSPYLQRLHEILHYQRQDPINIPQAESRTLKDVLDLPWGFEICGQCLQLHGNPVASERCIVFSCLNQDQDLDMVDFASLNSRLRQNSVQEELTALWIKRCLAGINTA